MINAKLRSTWNKVMSPVGGALARTPLTPDQVTVVGVLLQGLAAWYIVQGRLFVAALVSVVAAFADAFDGALARAKGTGRPFGALLDSTTDRLADALVFLPVAWLYGVDPATGHESEMVALLALVALVASFLVSYVKARAEGLGFDCNVGIAERAERLIVIILSMAFDVLPIGVGIIAVASIITFFQRLIHVRSQAARVAGG